MQVRQISQDELDPFIFTGKADRKAFKKHLQELKREQIEVVQYRVSASPTPEGLASSKPLLDLVTKLGFECRQERIEFERPSDSPSLETTGRLNYHTRAEVGESAFLESLALIFQESLDAELQKNCAELGPQQFALQYLSKCPKEDERNTWFSELSYDAKNDLVGVIMPLSRKRKNPRKGRSVGCIYTIGVIPQKRGQGYINDLLGRGTRILEREGATGIAATAAATNFPMANAFERANYKQKEQWWNFEIHLNSKI